MTNKSRKSVAMRNVKDTSNMKQVIEVFSERSAVYKSRALLCATRQVVKTGKPVCTNMGIINPTKLDLSKLNLKQLGG